MQFLQEFINAECIVNVNFTVSYRPCTGLGEKFVAFSFKHKDHQFMLILCIGNVYIQRDKFGKENQANLDELVNSCNQTLYLLTFN